jgi:hypothetical protein
MTDQHNLWISLYFKYQLANSSHTTHTASLLLTSYTNSRSEIWGVGWRYNKSCRMEGDLKKTAALPNYAKCYTYITESVGRKLRQPVSVQAWMRPPHTSLLLFTDTLYLQTQTLLAKGSDVVKYMQNITFQNLHWTSEWPITQSSWLITRSYDREAWLQFPFSCTSYLLSEHPTRSTPPPTTLFH